MSKKDELREKIIAQGKAAHKGELFLAEYTMTDREGSPMELIFTFREPTGAEMITYQKMASSDSLDAGRWLMGQVMVSSIDEDTMGKIGSHHNAVAAFITDYFNPLFGTVSETKPLRKV